MKFNFLSFLFVLLISAGRSFAQTHYPVNGADNSKNWTTVFINAHIKTADTEYLNGQMLIRGNKIIAIGKKVGIPKNARVIDLQGKWIYPSFIELCSEYGTKKPHSEKNQNKTDHITRRQKGPQADRTTSGAKYWNEAVHPEDAAIANIDPDEKEARELMQAGFGIVLAGEHDGIIQGQSALLMLGTDKIHDLVIDPHAALSVSFSKGRSKQDYPNSQMGSIALIRQAVHDAKWYKEKKENNNISLEALSVHLTSPWVGYTTDWQEVQRMDNLLSSFGIKAIIRGNGDEFKNLQAMSGIRGFLVVPFYPENEKGKKIPLSELPYNELQSMALRPQNMAMLSKIRTVFGITSSGNSTSQFAKKLREAVEYGLDPDVALDALTRLPAEKLGKHNIGDLKPGYLANFFICDSNFFLNQTTILNHWTNGTMHDFGPSNVSLSGTYSIVAIKDTLELKITQSKSVLTGSIGPKSKAGRVSFEGTNIYIHYKDLQLTGSINESGLISGTGYSAGTEFHWKGVKVDEKKKKARSRTYPKMEYQLAFSYADKKSNDYLIRNATVWTSSAKGVMPNSDVLIKDGKIVSIGKNLELPAGTSEIDGTGKHLTPGFIDEHSHIAISKGVNEGTQAVTSEVRIADVVNANDINIYRQLAGGVTTSHLLHGSANPIGGQTALIKLRYGEDPQGLMFGNDHRFIKFALGENVKHSNWGDKYVVRFPQTRMGVEQTFMDGFTRALEYEKCRKTNNCAIDLELEALLEIVQGKRFITCHSYRQDEINMLMHVADSFDFTVNTFTHILEGYKVADKMKMHGVGASTFSDWWGYKFEVNDAIPWNAAILNSQGIITAINSDDPEMGRRLNQEAAKTIKYGGVSEEDALKMITINPAKLLHIENRTGSIEVGKDGDVVLWDSHPLSNYSKVETTWVEGIIYFDQKLNKNALDQLFKRRSELIDLLTTNGLETGDLPEPEERSYHCDDLD